MRMLGSCGRAPRDLPLLDPPQLPRSACGMDPPQPEPGPDRNHFLGGRVTLHSHHHPPRVTDQSADAKLSTLTALIRAHMHEIDNLSTVILSTCELALDRRTHPLEMRGHVVNIQKTAQRLVAGSRSLVQAAWRP